MAESKSNRFNFTDRGIDAHIKNHPGDDRLWDTDTPGLNLWVSKKSYYFTKKVGGRTFNRKLGYRSLMPIKSAREAAASLFVELSKGTDPLVKRREQETRQQAARVTLKEALDAMLADGSYRTATEKTYQHMVIEAGTFYDYANKPISSITPAIVATRHREVAKQSESMANRDCRTLRAVWNWGKDKYHLGDNPVAVLNKKNKKSGQQGWAKPTRKKSMIARAKLGDWFGEVRKHQQSEDNYTRTAAYALEVMLLMGLRKNEILSLTWERVDATSNTLTIPPDVSKNHRPLIRPMPKRVVEIVDGLRGNSDQWVFAGEEGKHIESARPVMVKIKKATGVWATSNDLRRTFLSCAPAAGLAQFVIKSLVNHTTDNGDVTEGYQNTDLQTLLEAGQAVEDFILLESGMTDSSLDRQLKRLISELTDDQKRALIFQLSDPEKRDKLNIAVFVPEKGFTGSQPSVYAGLRVHKEG